MSLPRQFMEAQIERIEANAATRERNRVLLMVSAVLPSSEADYVVSAVRELLGEVTTVGSTGEGNSEDRLAATPSGEPTAAAAAQQGASGTSSG